MILSFSHGSEFVAGGQMKADQWTNPLTQIETLFQSRVRGANFEDESIHGNCFRKRGLTEVFRRRNSGDIFTANTGRSPGVRDVPGGALRFRLRAHADVMVFFTASILRLNHWDESLEDADGNGPWSLINPTTGESLYPYIWSHIGFRAYWEGGKREPGEQFVQAQSYMAQQAAFIDKVNVGRQVFLCYRIRPQDVGLNPSLHGVLGEKYLMYEGQDEIIPEQPEDLRMVDTAVSSLSGGPYGEEDVSRLLPGWHNIRHTFHHAREDDFTPWSLPISSARDEPQTTRGLDLDENPGIRSTPQPFVFGSTELVVVADYGPRPSAWSETISDKGLGDREEEDRTGSSVGKFEADR